MGRGGDATRGTILWVASGDETGGVGRSLLAVSAALKGEALTVRVASLSPGRLVDLADRHGVETTVGSPSQVSLRTSHACPPRVQTPASLILAGPAGWARALQRAVSRSAWTDIRGVHVRSPMLLSVGGALAQSLNVPLVWQVANAPGSDRRLNQLVYRWAVRRWQAKPLANSRYVRDRFRFLGDIPWAYVPIESAFLRAAIVPPPRGPLRFLSMGRASRSKGQSILVSAFENFMGHSGCGELRIVGLRDGEPASDALRRQVAASRWHSAIQLQAYSDDPRAEFEGCHIVVAGQTGQEPFGQVAAQGLALGRPVLAVGRGGPAELVAETGFGWRVASFSRDHVAAGLRTAAGEYGDLATGAREAQRHAREMLDPRHFRRIYRGLIE